MSVDGPGAEAGAVSKTCLSADDYVRRWNSPSEVGEYCQSRQGRVWLGIDDDDMTMEDDRVGRDETRDEIRGKDRPLPVTSRIIRS